MFREARNFMIVFFIMELQLKMTHIGVVPEMMWIKVEGTNNWVVYHKDMDSSAPEDYCT